MKLEILTEDDGKKCDTFCPFLDTGYFMDETAKCLLFNEPLKRHLSPKKYFGYDGFRTCDQCQKVLFNLKRNAETDEG